MKMSSFEWFITKIWGDVFVLLCFIIYVLSKIEERKKGEKRSVKNI
jgi:uncharacterized membrane protein YfhO